MNNADYESTSYTEFVIELGELINRHRLENASDTPDFILANYLMDCLAAFDNAVIARENRHNRT